MFRSLGPFLFKRKLVMIIMKNCEEYFWAKVFPRISKTWTLPLTRQVLSVLRLAFLTRQVSSVLRLALLTRQVSPVLTHQTYPQSCDICFPYQTGTLSAEILAFLTRQVCSALIYLPSSPDRYAQCWDTCLHHLKELDRYPQCWKTCLPCQTGTRSGGRLAFLARQVPSVLGDLPSLPDKYPQCWETCLPHQTGILSAETFAFLARHTLSSGRRLPSLPDRNLQLTLGWLAFLCRQIPSVMRLPDLAAIFIHLFVVFILFVFKY